MATPATRYMSPAILGSLVMIAKVGDKVGSIDVTAGALPALPTDSLPGTWLTLGEIKNFKITPEKKQVKVEGYNRAGGYNNKDLSFNLDYKFTFQTHWLSPEALQLTYGSVKPLADSAADLAVYTSAGSKIDCWLYHTLDDVLAGNKELLNNAQYGSLRLVNPINIASDPVLCDWEFTPDRSNTLGKTKATGIYAPGV